MGSLSPRVIRKLQIVDLLKDLNARTDKIIPSEFTTFDDRYVFGKIINIGSISKVFKAFDTGDNNRLVAIKVINRRDYDLIYDEISILEALDHPNVIKLLNYYKDAKYIYVVLEYMGVDLYDYIEKNDSLSEPEIFHILKQILDALEYIHKSHIAHMDIKIENITYEPISKQIKLIDFGLAIEYSPGELLRKVVGSKESLTPEMIQEKLYDPLKVDVWCLGYTMISMFQFHFPFNIGELCTEILHKDPYFELGASSEFKELIRHMMRKQYRDRATFDDIRNSEWFKKYDDTTKASESDIFPTDDEITI